MDLLVTVKEIKGTCPVYTPGQEFIIREGYRLESDKPVCMHALASLMHTNIQEGGLQFLKFQQGSRTLSGKVCHICILKFKYPNNGS